MFDGCNIIEVFEEWILPDKSIMELLGKYHAMDTGCGVVIEHWT